MTNDQHTKLYVLEKSNSYMCFPACLNMIFKRRGLRVFPQQQIAYSLNLKVPLPMKEKYPGAQFTEIEAEWGVHPNERNLLEEFINKNEIKLSLKYINARDIPSHSIMDFLCDNLEAGNDIIVGYDYAAVFQDGLNVGHVSLISSVDDLRNLIILTDPEEVQPVQINAKQLTAGILKGSSGFWVFSSPNGRIFTCYL